MNAKYMKFKKEIHTATLIETKHLTKSYTLGQSELKVLNDIDLKIIEGEFLSIMGPSGSGKSTLLYLLGGLESPSQGDIVINDKTISNMNDKTLSTLRGNTIGFVFQFYNLVPHLSVMDNILLPGLLSGKKKKELMSKMDELLQSVGLTEKKHALPSQLSGGQQQRVAIARALISEPKILLADEPIGNLDSKTGKEIMDLFVKLHQEKGITIVQVTHSMDSALYGDRIIHLKDGEIYEESYVEKEVILA